MRRIVADQVAAKTANASALSGAEGKLAEAQAQLLMRALNRQLQKPSWRNCTATEVALQVQPCCARWRVSPHGRRRPVAHETVAPTSRSAVAWTSWSTLVSFWRSGYLPTVSTAGMDQRIIQRSPVGTVPALPVL